ncbi:G patch domain-containing protein 1 homolog isoform X2 [Anoplophora glabripennis]|uniref:G patch domain-containing protein 1 homolog isoform X1 n=1 Tax=Anoplophora glabripennis TaxID=217634 RepID=UPI000873FDBC|nr:G patch domain-containing protein 1 homolog isoform X1 [Anoplophora glabripennis]XP_023311687.1 G patch domain-containing protein 1 homolog isoform X2 [Anoplophora glabripennis]
MSDSEEENYCYFGKPLDPYDEDAFPKKKPISVEEQIATDAEGRRRFHGAFTGGFSAGFFNTVGSLEGWTPSEFKSTRQDKAKNVMQKPEDFMDDEDFGEYGIAHQTVKATKEFSTVKKRKRQMFPDGPIPGEPVLQTLLCSGNETVGYLLLKNIGIQDKIINQQEVDSTEEKVYGCQIPKEYRIPKSIENKQYHIPKIYETFLKNPKSNTFGLGYKGLDKSHINLFESTSLVMRDKNNKKISIKGQAFGVGAFEEEDDDIYAKEDMTKYDFELTKEKSGKIEADKRNLLFCLFKQSKAPLLFSKLYPPPNIPHSFTGKHKVRKSRFEPLLAEESSPKERKEINPAIRAAYLGENVDKTYTESKSIVEPEPEKKQENTKSKQENATTSFDISSVLISDRFVSAVEEEDVNNILKPVEKMETTHGTKELREAARMKMFGILTRVTTDWHPCSILCKRFNVPEPFMDRPDEKNKKRTKNLIFEYQKHSEDQNILSPGLSIQTKQEENTTPTSVVADSIKINDEVMEPEQNITDVLKQEQSEVTDIKKNNDEPELENVPKDITEKVDVAQNLDLFKAVFLSSSESEDEDVTEEKTDTNKIEELKANVLSDSLIPKIKPIKEGILSNVNFHIFSNPKKDTQVETKVENSTSLNSIDKEETEVVSYGPALPSNKIKITKATNEASLSSDNEDVWVEKGEGNSKKDKHKKKHKKEKRKKHKRDKKKSRSEK